MKHTVYPPDERPEVEVLVDGAWHYGQLRMSTHDATADGRLQVTWTARPASTSSTRFAPSGCVRWPWRDGCDPSRRDRTTPRQPRVESSRMLYETPRSWSACSVAQFDTGGYPRGVSSTRACGPPSSRSRRPPRRGPPFLSRGPDDDAVVPPRHRLDPTGAQLAPHPVIADAGTLSLRRDHRPGRRVGQ